MRIGLIEILLVIAVVSLVFGPKRLASMGRSLKTGIHGFLTNAMGKGHE